MRGSLLQVKEESGKKTRIHVFLDWLMDMSWERTGVESTEGEEFEYLLGSLVIVPSGLTTIWRYW